MDPRTGAIPIAQRASVTLACLLWCGVIRADKFTYETPDGRQTVEGQLVARTDAEVLFVGRDGRMHLEKSNRVLELQENTEKPRPFTKEEMISELRHEFGSGF